MYKFTVCLNFNYINLSFSLVLFCSHVSPWKLTYIIFFIKLTIKSINSVLGNFSFVSAYHLRNNLAFILIMYEKMKWELIWNILEIYCRLLEISFLKFDYKLLKLSLNLHVVTVTVEMFFINEDCQPLRCFS